jgi:glucose/mannose-6-phosphate isomerase
LSERINIPVIVSDSYYLPNFISKDTLIFVISYSGNTVEVINLLHQLLTRDLNLNIVVLSGGGNLENLTRENNLPFIKIRRVEPKKRTVLPYLAIPLLLILNDVFSLGLNTNYFDKITKEISLLRDEIDISCKMKENFAKYIASKMFNKIPFIYSSKSSIYPVAVRWKFQLNENSKVFAFSNYLPNINHNEIMPWRYMNCAIVESFAVFFLRDRDDEVYISERVNFTKKVIKESKVKIFEIYLRGSNILEKIFKGVLIGDFVSYYLAILRNIDPSDVSEISRIKTIS